MTSLKGLKQIHILGIVFNQILVRLLIDHCHVSLELAFFSFFFFGVGGGGGGVSTCVGCIYVYVGKICNVNPYSENL